MKQSNLVEVSVSVDWPRLQKALTVEVERGFQNLQGKQHRFGDFLCLSFGSPPPPGTPPVDRQKWREFAQRFAQYDQLEQAERKSLVASTRRFLHQLRRSLESPCVDAVGKTAPPALVNRPRVSESRRSQSSRVELHTPLATVLSQSQHQTKLLNSLGLATAEDLLFYFPRDYLDYAQQVTIAELTAGETVTIVGRVVNCTCFTSPKNQNLTILQIQLRDQTGRIKLSRFYAGRRFAHRAWQETLKKLYPPHAVVAASGLVKANKFGLTLDNPEIEVLDRHSPSIDSFKVGRVLPVYPLTEGLTADFLRKLVLACQPAIAQLSDPLPREIRAKYELIDLKTAIAQIHFPDNGEQLSLARRRLVFDEFFYLQLGFLQRRYEQKQQQQSAIFTPSGELLEKFSDLLPFRLTQAQQRVVNEILEDLSQSSPMNRLVQGDVGSGKTVVGVFAILAALQGGYQAALMAPTEVLAEQHYQKLVGWFNLLHLPVELLTGSTKTAKRREIHGHLATGQLPLLVGTHALIQEPVNFQRLGLVVIDEQHRFGVQQRAKLLAKGNAPHVLSMTATPIPRTLALTLHGDLEVSQIDELPPGRQPIRTNVITTKERPQMYELIRREVAQGRQVYIIFPAIEQSEKLDIKAAVEEHKHLSEKIFPNFNIGLLHGRLKSTEKEAVLQAFREKVTEIIVSTTVIEVGVDVPNATVMVIENAERFGLSQLHQLRGRVGRGSHQSHCLLVTNSKSPDARQRLGVMEQSQDGFFIAEMDLRLRGPGEFLGTKQSGLPDFALASLVEDQDVLLMAREAAEQLIVEDPSLAQYPNLKTKLAQRYEKLLRGEILT
ncbi:ATP-dependent DNA helicase RecG [Synechocystis sp. PCC 7339]|uniref:ATP-dependent DNA helicase RecG n=1 Tax=Synechocystis sp. PCC 7339 TaxID=2782213 RepID=UPI001CC156A6|nr:ATP-dependent DNA helicase RecG [Synechocystis sp. PCC 7339]UAJ74472.1 ATP-dependent DNA helicase RecG [Synechocystis sp. PCC 7339]